MKRLLLVLTVFILFRVHAPASSELFDFYIPWNDSSHTITDLSSYVNRDIDADGFVSATADGHFAVNSGRIRFWGTNTTFGGNFPSNTNSEAVAARLAKYGFNVIRFHHMDMYNIWTTTNPDRVISAAQLQKMDYFINELKKNGIYTDLNLLVSRPFAQGTELNGDINLITDWKVRAVLGFFDPAVLQLQKDFARDLLTHVNPYTGNAYINEPAIAYIEINNENGLVHAFLSQQLDSLPPYYKNELSSQWNAWLKNKYADDAALETGWGIINQPLGAEILANTRFATGVLAPWAYNPQPGVVGTGTVDAAAGPGGINAAKINVVTPGSAGWYVQFNQGGLNVTAGVPYTITFYAKADSARTVSVALGMAHDPWANLGFSANINLTAAWQLFTFTFTPSASDTNARINFGEMGLAANATYWFTDISLRQGGLLGLAAGETLYGSGIANFNYGFAGRTDGGKKDWFRFLTQTEETYWVTMRDYVKNTLGAQSLVFGTIIGCSNPNVQANFDAIDTHAYWEHPQFPGTPWDSVNWYLNNRAMVNYPDSSTIASIAMKSVLNKPHLVTETNSPHPGTFSSDHSFMTSAYASFQDWDAIFPFDYNGDDNWDKRYIDGYFAVSNNPLKMASYPASVISFYRGDISPADQTVVVPINRTTEIDQLLTAGAWKLVDAEKAGENAKAGYVHGVRIAVDGQSVPGGALSPGTTNVTGPVLTSDTGELIWDNTYPLNGVFMADSAMTKYLTGFTAERTYYMSGVTITPHTGLQPFSAIAVTALDGSSFSSATKILVTALGCEKNTGDSWYIYPNTATAFPPAHGASITLRNQWGAANSKVEGITADFILPADPANTRVWALDNRGARAMTVTVTDNGGFAQFGISGGYSALWYEVEVLHPEYTPTVTATITPVFSPTNTPTITITPTPVTADVVDDFEIAGTQNYWLGYWYPYMSAGSTNTAQEESPGGPVTTNGLYHASGTIAAGGYGGIGTNLAAAGGEKDLTAYAGLKFYVKNTVAFDVAIITGNYSDIPVYNNPQYTVSPNAGWTLITIPFSSFTVPYGTALPFDLTRAEDIQWKLRVGAFDISLDDVAFYYDLSTKTVTPTITQTLSSTATRTMTLTPTITPSVSRTITGTITVTCTNTLTVTETNTPGATPSYTQTVTPSVQDTAGMTVTQTETVTVTETVTAEPTATFTATPVQTAPETYTDKPQITDVLLYPHPYTGSGNLRVRFNIENNARFIRMRLYTQSFRLIRDIKMQGPFINGQCTAVIAQKEIRGMANGTYYYVMDAFSDSADKAASRSKAGLLTVIAAE